MQSPFLYAEVLMKTLDELWYGNLSPFEQCTRGDRRLKELLSLMARNRDELDASLTDKQKETFCYQLHSKTEAVGEGIALGNAMHLVHAVLELFERFLLLFRERAVQFLTVPGNQLQ